VNQLVILSPSVILSLSKDEPIGHPELLLVILSLSKDEPVCHPELVEG